LQILDSQDTVQYIDEGGILKKLVIYTIPALLLGLLLTGCSSNGNSDVTPPANSSTIIGLAFDGVSKLYVADADGHVIRTADVTTGAVTVLAGAAFSAGSTDGTGAAARFNFPFGVARIGTDYFVTDTGNHTIRKVTSAGVVTTIAGTALTSGVTDGTGAAARFYYPKGITTDGTDLYVTDSRNHTIRKVTTAGVVTTVAGYAGTPGLPDGAGYTARFNNPYSIAFDSGNLYVADAWNNSLRKIVIAGGYVVTTLAGSTTGVAGSADGTAGAASFYAPAGVAVYSGFAYVADNGNATIRKVDLSNGATTTLAGTAGMAGATDGTGSAARFYWPNGIVSDGSGNLYVADSGNKKIRKIVTATGAVSSLSASF
jgi:hypothetical protein